MAAIAFLAVQILSVTALPGFHHPVSPHSQIPPPGVIAPGSSLHLRGVSGPASAPAPAQFVDERGPRGHFYYSDGCEDCVYKGAQCGCQSAVEYFACLTKHCHPANHSQFAAKCAEVATNCSSDLDVVCRGPESSCTGKFNQLPSGGIGLTLDLDGVENDAFCGPHGKCMGTIHMKANIHQPPLQLMAPGPAPAPAPAPSPAAFQQTFLECGLPNVPDADSHNQTQWTLCRAPVLQGIDKAACDLPMLPTLAAGEGKEAYCVLTQGTEGNPPTRLTQPVWHLIKNTHAAKSTAHANTAAAAGLALLWAALSQH